MVDCRGIAGMFEASAPGHVAGLQIVMDALFSADVAWSPTDLAEADHPGAVIRMLRAASGAQVVGLEVDE